MMKKSKELRPIDVLVDLLAGAEFDHQILDAETSAKIIIEALHDAGYEITAIPEDRP